ncbi:MAG: heat-inducible transcriptional repressor HrcA [Oscillospiraceae bacterium]|nr:heat-inducible transcriptional repressor HrcA [Oscillospiraceae bacterium]
MDARKKRILKAIVDNYIGTAEPVGSKVLSGKQGLDVSPATLRNEMASLEEMGYLLSPHTSSGRIPTPSGYRLYVDELMRRRRLTSLEQEAISKAARLRVAELDRLLAKAGRIVSELTHYAAIATVRREKSISIDRLELFLSDTFSLVMVAVLEGGFVKNHICRLPFPGQREQVRALSEILSGLGNPLDANEADLCAKAGVSWVYWPYVRGFLQSLSNQEREVVLTGESQLLTHPEFQDIPRAKRTLEYLSSQQENIMIQMPEAMEKDGIRISIGPENVAAELENTSVVMADYRLSDGMRGMIGVIGPTRMDYGHLVSRLAYFAKTLQSSLLDENDQKGR